MAKKIIKLCPECYYDYRAGGIQFDNKKLKVVKVESVEQCDLENKKVSSKKKLKRVM